MTGLPGNTYAHLTLATPDVAALVRRHGRRGLAARQVDLRVRGGLLGEGGAGSPQRPVLGPAPIGLTVARPIPRVRPGW